MESNYQPFWVEEDRARVVRMDELYLEDGRDKPDHPFHGLYTGLHQKALEREKAKSAFPFVAR